jgi:hypothetical protein
LFLRDADSIQGGLRERLALCHFNNAEELVQLHFFLMKKTQPEGEVYFRITVEEFAAPPPGLSVRFFAEADRSVNQKTASVVPFGWGDSLRRAISECVRMIRQFPPEGEEGGCWRMRTVDFSLERELASYG